MRVLRLAVAPLGVAFGLAVEWGFYDSSLGLALTVVDFLVGCLLVVGGTIAWDRRAGSRVGALMTLAGLTWFLGNLGGALVYLHRGPLVHLVLSYPSGRLRGWVSRVVVALAYLDALVEPLARNDKLTIALAAAVAVAACITYVASSGPARKAGAPALVSTLAFAAALWLGAVGRLDAMGHRDAVLLVYDLVIASITLLLLVDLLRGRWAERTVSGLVVDLGATSDSAGLRAKLAHALGDPSLALGYRLDEADGFVDDAGRPLALPAQVSGRTVTSLTERGRQIGVLVHDDAVLADPILIDSVAAAAQLVVANARLQAEARSQATGLESSRRRIVESTDRQRRRLERELREGPERLIDNARVALVEAAATSAGGDADRLAALAAELGRAEEELREFGHGVLPPALTERGLTPALAELARHSPIPVRVTGEIQRLPEPIEATIYFVSAEALANAVKHAAASEVTIDVGTAGDRCRVVIADDGVGGAVASRGSGLTGLRDRVEALGGTLRLDSPPGDGTRVAAEIELFR